MRVDRVDIDMLTVLSSIVAALPYDSYLKAAKKAGVTELAEVLGRAHIISGLSEDTGNLSYQSSLERDPEDGLSYEFVRGDWVYIRVHDPNDWRCGFLFDLTLMGREEPMLEIWPFDDGRAFYAADEFPEEPSFRVSLDFKDLSSVWEPNGPPRRRPPSLRPPRPHPES